MSAGYVYVLTNPSMPGIVKIGRSKHSGRKRAEDIYKGSTGVPERFYMEFEIWSRDCVSDELTVHEELQKERISPDREFFRIDEQDAILVVSNVVLSTYNIVAGWSDTTICEWELFPSYGKECVDMIGKEVPGVPEQITLKNALAFHLTNEQIIEAVVAYKAWCEERLKKTRKERSNDKPESNLRVV